jgi:hypothetical protein
MMGEVTGETTGEVGFDDGGEVTDDEDEARETGASSGR